MSMSRPVLAPLPSQNNAGEAAPTLPGSVPKSGLPTGANTGQLVMPVNQNNGAGDIRQPPARVAYPSSGQAVDSEQWEPQPSQFDNSAALASANKSKASKIGGIPDERGWKITDFPAEIASLLNLFDDDGDGHINMDEVKRAAEFFQAGRDRHSKNWEIPFEVFPKHMHSVLKEFDRHGKSTVDTVDIQFALSSLHSERKKSNMFRNAAIFLIIVVVFMIFAVSGMTVALIQVTKETDVKSGGVMIDRKTDSPVMVASSDFTVSSDGQLVTRATEGRRAGTDNPVRVTGKTSRYVTKYGQTSRRSGDHSRRSGDHACLANVPTVLDIVQNTSATLLLTNPNGDSKTCTVTRTTSIIIKKGEYTCDDKLGGMLVQKPEGWTVDPTCLGGVCGDIGDLKVTEVHCLDYKHPFRFVYDKETGIMMTAVTELIPKFASTSRRRSLTSNISPPSTRIDVQPHHASLRNAPAPHCTSADIEAQGQFSADQADYEYLPYLCEIDVTVFDGYDPDYAPCPLAQQIAQQVYNWCGGDQDIHLQVLCAATGDSAACSGDLSVLYTSEP